MILKNWKMNTKVMAMILMKKLVLMDMMDFSIVIVVYAFSLLEMFLILEKE
jgi:hypothetical protein